MKETKSNYCEHCGEFHDPVRDYTARVKVGETVPDFEFEAYHEDSVKVMSLSKLRGKWAVLVFYHADFTFICPTELESAADLYEEFKKLGAEVMSVSTDTVFAHKAWHDTSPAIAKVTFPMLADPTGNFCRQFGTYIEKEGLPLRGTFIMDPDGILKSIEINDNSIGRSADELIRKLQAAKFVREHKGKVCPANWHPGDKTLEPGMGLVGKI